MNQLQQNIAHPALLNSSARFSFYALFVLRFFFFSLVIYCVDAFFDLGTANLALCLAAGIGTLIASMLAFTRLTNFAFIGIALLVYLAYKLFFALMQFGVAGFFSNPFLIHIIQLHLDLLLVVMGIAAFSTWYFWKSLHAVTVETILLGIACIIIVSGHRNLHLEMPRFVNTLAWDLGISELATLVALGASIFVLTLSYLYIATMPERPIANLSVAQSKAHKGRTPLYMSIGSIVLLGLVLHLVSKEIYQHYKQVAQSRVSNGVGQATQAGQSPLGFHSALGRSSQPTALVRLEGDYLGNPFSPMIYLRESALSEFNGKELVTASANYDTDVNRSTPADPYSSREDNNLTNRVNVVQSIYLLNEHNLAFALDYPIAIKQLKNPKPDRFKAAYRAYSIAPNFSIESLNSLSVGDPRWPESTLQHYLIAHSDPRYANLAKKITEGIDAPVEKARAIVNFLSKNSIYTLTPNHEVKEDEDPVAPYLFGDMRGYCVHFAHATVYMLRALGIPARIGTGYLSDLSQSRDGHLLLRSSDRHAWAEAYIEGRGWVPFDTQPEQVESHAETNVDMNVLEELMSILDPGEEILPKQSAADELNLQQADVLHLPEAHHIVLFLILALVFLILSKIYLLFAWLLPGGTYFKLRKTYLALATYLYDLGYARKTGETRAEFSQRIGLNLGLDLAGVVDTLYMALYAKEGKQKINNAELEQARSQALHGLGNIKAWKKILALLNPASTFYWIASGGRF